MGALLDDDDPGLFAKLTDEQLELLARRGRERAIKHGDILFCDGDTGHHDAMQQQGAGVTDFGEQRSSG
jgi:hypothetical protein